MILLSSCQDREINTAFPEPLFLKDTIDHTLKYANSSATKPKEQEITALISQTKQLIVDNASVCIFLPQIMSNETSKKRVAFVKDSFKKAFPYSVYFYQNKTLLDQADSLATQVVVYQVAMPANHDPKHPENFGYAVAKNRLLMASDPVVYFESKTIETVPSVIGVKAIRDNVRNENRGDNISQNTTTAAQATPNTTQYK